MLKFFKNHNYVIKVSPMHDGESCLVMYPPKIISSPTMEEQACIYTINDGTLSYYSDWYEEIHEVDCPRYAARIVIFQDILIKASLWGLSEDFIVYYNEEGEELFETNFIDVVAGPSAEEEVKLENKLATIFYAAFPDFSEDWEVVAKENGVEEGYRLIILNQGESDE